MPDKNSVREKNKILRRSLDIKRASGKIVSKILQFEPFINSKEVLFFYPLKNEINLLPLIISGKNFYLPKIFNDELLICPYSNNLKKSSFGVMEPQDSPIYDISKIEIAFIPALAIDKNLNRIGYGKGFYDRLFLKKEFKALKIAVINKELLVDEIEICPLDKKVDMVITDL